MLIFPTSTSSDYTQTIVVETESYDLRIQYNPRETAWYLELGFSGLDPALRFKAVNGQDLLLPYTSVIGIPPGSIYLVDTVAFFGRVGRDDFDQEGRFNLVYLTEAENELSKQGLLT
jgi:hypothetical protein